MDSKDFDLNDIIGPKNINVLDTLSELADKCDNIQGMIIGYYSGDKAYYIVTAGLDNQKAAYLMKVLQLVIDDKISNNIFEEDDE